MSEKPRVLLADDNEATRTLMTALLQKQYVLEQAADGRETIDALRSRQYAAVLLDLLMPGVDGFEVLDFLKAENPELLRNVVVVTASLAGPTMQRMRSYDVFRVVPKPFEVDALYQAVRECTQQSHGPNPLGGPLVSSGVLLLLSELVKRV
jgi:CheY-like chemotaxis protein